MEAFVYLAVFIASMTSTPGPGNLLMMTGGANYGVKHCMKFNLGLMVGFGLQNVATGLGLGVLIRESENIQLILKFVSAGYMIWLAIQSWNSNPKSSPSSQFTFVKGFLLHPLSPKSWLMLIIAWTEFNSALGDFPIQILTMFSFFFLGQLIFHTGWCWMGSLLGRTIQNSLLLTRSLVVLTIVVILAVLWF